MNELNISALTELVSQLFANARDNQAFNADQRRQWLIKGIEYRQLLLKLIGIDGSKVISQVQDANNRLKEITQRLKDKQETLRKYNKTVEDLITLAEILGQIIDIVSVVVPFHAMAASPAPMLNRGLVAEFASPPPASLTPTEGYIGSGPHDPSGSASKLLVKGKGSMAELIVMPKRSTILVPPYANTPSPAAPNSPLPLESLIGRDDRIRILDTFNAPWRMICSLSIQANGNYVGTGWFAGPKTIITAAHCLYLKQMGGWARQIRIFPGRDGNDLPYEAVSEKLEVPQEWRERRGRNPDYDYGVIHLDTKLGEKTGWFSVAVANDEQLSDAFVNLSGYPGDVAGGFGIYQLFHADQVSDVAENRFFYAIDTFGGQSGSPVWQEGDNGQRQVVGIHTYGVGGSFALNSATRITPLLFNDIKQWLEN
jgi:V8-like Glu-specific endopeptidase